MTKKRPTVTSEVENADLKQLWLDEFAIKYQCAYRELGGNGENGKTLVQVNRMLHVSFRLNQSWLVLSVQRTHYSKPVSLVEPHLSFHFFSLFFVSFLFLTTITFLRLLITLRLSR